MHSFHSPCIVVQDTIHHITQKRQVLIVAERFPKNRNIPTLERRNTTPFSKMRHTARTNCRMLRKPAQPIDFIRDKADNLAIQTTQSLKIIHNYLGFSVVSCLN
jgi:hypothetical protein